MNDVHSGLNATRVRRILRPLTTAQVQRIISTGARSGDPIAICGSRHAMGGQQFAEGALLLDTSKLERTIALDSERGTVEVSAGVEWPELIHGIHRQQKGHTLQWGIAQKQTGADRFTIGGALASNIHGRGLTMRPLIGDVESFVLIDPAGRVRRCSRHQDPELFRLAIGGYGLFGVVTSVQLRLIPRRVIQRCVEVIGVRQLTSSFERRIAEGHLYGDFQFATDPRSDAFLDLGVFSTYRPVDGRVEVPRIQKELRAEEWRALLHLAHADRSAAFDRYAQHYLSTAGQLYWTDTHQLSTYLPDYHRELDAVKGGRSSEVITEVYVPRDELASFMAEARDDLREDASPLVYGTIRLIERDRESALPWARNPYACIIFNLCTRHTREGVRRSARTFRRLIDRAIARGGSYYLTYHRDARRDQVVACYPGFVEFLRRKQEYDPGMVIQSSWYRHYRGLFEEEL